MASERHHPAALRIPGRIGRGPAFLIDEGAGRHLLTLQRRDPRLGAGYGRGREVHDHGRLVAGRDAYGDGVGVEQRLAPPVRDRYGLLGTVAGRPHEGDHALRHGHLGVLPHPADVGRPHQADRRHILVARLGNGRVHGELRDDVAEGPVAGDERGGGRLGDDLRPLGGDDRAVPDLGDVPGQVEDAVGVDAAQVRQHERVGHAGGVALVGARGQQDARRQVVEVGGGDRRHVSFS